MEKVYKRKFKLKEAEADIEDVIDELLEPLDSELERIFKRYAKKLEAKGFLASLRNKEITAEQFEEYIEESDASDSLIKRVLLNYVDTDAIVEKLGE